MDSSATKFGGLQAIIGRTLFSTVASKVEEEVCVQEMMHVSVVNTVEQLQITQHQEAGVTHFGGHAARSYGRSTTLLAIDRL